MPRIIKDPMPRDMLVLYLLGDTVRPMHTLDRRLGQNSKRIVL